MGRINGAPSATPYTAWDASAKVTVTPRSTGSGDRLSSRQGGEPRQAWERSRCFDDRGWPRSTASVPWEARSACNRTLVQERRPTGGIRPRGHCRLAVGALQCSRWPGVKSQRWPSDYSAGSSAQGTRVRALSGCRL